MLRNNGRWLTLGEASETLGVTASTLRRWADRGQIPSFTTPGGHRRFLLTAVEAMVPAGRVRRPALAPNERMASAYRRVRPTRANHQSAWLARMSDDERNGFRERGTRLVRDLLAYLDADRRRAAELLDGAAGQAREYGAEASRVGASLSDTVEGFLRFRKPFVDELAVVARRGGLDTAEATSLMVDAEAALDRLLIELMQGHGSVPK